MEDLEKKLSSVLSDPSAMAQIQALAQNLNLGNAEAPQANPGPDPSAMDLSMIQKFAGLARQSSVDKNQQTLLKALGPYLSRQRLQKLERAMRAAKMASAAGLLTGR